MLTPSFAHDGSIGALLGVLQTRQPIWPGMASEVVFELWTKQAQDYVQVLFSGQPLATSTPLGTLDMIPLVDWNAYLKGVLLKDIVEICNS